VAEWRDLQFNGPVLEAFFGTQTLRTTCATGRQGNDGGSDCGNTAFA
jgi:hypothetical protein